MTSDADSRVILANAIDHLADSIDHLAVASQAIGLPQPPNGVPAPPLPPNGGKPEKTPQQKRGGLIWGQCKDHNVTVQATGESVLGRSVPADARTWPDADQQAVLDAMKSWNWIS